jgi:4-nitrophenyl phosphatase
MRTIYPDPAVGAVLFGFDLDINYKKLAKAFTYINSNPNCHFLATNSDLTFPAGGTVYPGRSSSGKGEIKYGLFVYGYHVLIR